MHCQSNYQNIFSSSFVINLIRAYTSVSCIYFLSYIIFLFNLIKKQKSFLDFVNLKLAKITNIPNLNQSGSG